MTVFRRMSTGGNERVFYILGRVRAPCISARLVMQIIGHENVLAALEKARETGRLAHGLCFVGPERVGKRAVALWLAGQLLGRDAHQHADFYLVERERDEKTDVLKHEISIEQIRQLREQLGQTSFFSGQKVAVIDGAEKMSLAAANALLKTLEEPSGKTTIILIASSSDALLPTISSRVQTLRFGVVSEETMVRGGIPVEFVRLAAGRPGVAINLQDPEIYEAFAQNLEECKEILSAPIWKRAKIIEGWFGKKKAYAEGIAELAERVRMWRTMLRESMLKQNGNLGELASAGLVGDNIPHAHAMLGRIDRLEELVQMNANVRYALEATFLT